MDILVVGGGGREHAVIHTLKRSPRCGRLYCAPGNGGIAADAECFDVAASDIPGMVSLARRLGVGMVFVAPDDPLADGMVDALEEAGIPAFGPNAAAAAIESSKVFSKQLMRQFGIPTAAYAVFDDPQKALAHIVEKGVYPAVVKADGLAKGKGAVLCADKEEAARTIDEIMVRRVFGDAGAQVVVEEFLTGPEVSVLAFTDGKTVVPMVSAKDHKRIFDGDGGPNTGGMGTVSPNPHYSEADADECMRRIFRPTVEAMAELGRPFKGCLFFGLMLTPDGPKVIEYNCRFGDPEAQVVLPRLQTDLIDVMEAVRNGTLDQLDIRWDSGGAACVVLASGGYPNAYPTGLPIAGLDAFGRHPGVTICHAGTKQSDDGFVTNGGRVLGICARGDNMVTALDTAYAAAAKIYFDGVHYRKDIGRTV